MRETSQLANYWKENKLPKASKPKREPIRKMKLHLSAKRSGKREEALIVTWKMPETKAMEVYSHFHQCLTAMLKAEGLLGGRES